MRITFKILQNKAVYVQAYRPHGTVLTVRKDYKDYVVYGTDLPTFSGTARECAAYLDGLRHGLRLLRTAD